MKQPNTIYHSGRIPVLMAALCGVLALVPAFIWGIPLGADLDAHFRFVMPFYDEIARGNINPGWLAESNNGFGDARFRFYPPVMFYALSLFRWLTGDWYAAFLIAFTLFSVVGTVGVYLWARQNLSPQTSVLAALIFAFVPYHLTQFYQASLLLEFAASAFIPYAFLFLGRITTGRGGRLPNIVGLSTAYSLIVLAHVPTTIIASISLAVFALVTTKWTAYRRTILDSAAAIGLGLIMSSFFWVKVVSELGWIQAGQHVTSEHYVYTNNFLFSPFSLPNLNTWYGGLVAALTVGFFLPSIIILPNLFARTTRTADSTIEQFQTVSLRSVALVAAFAFLMTTDLSRPIWWLVPKLKDIQFPFRWLTIVSVMICPLAAFALVAWKNRVRQIRPWHLLILLPFAATVLFSINELVIDSTYLGRQKFTERIESVRGGRSFSDWLPVGAAELKDLAPLDGDIDAGGRTVIASDWQTHHRQLVLAAGEPVQVRLRSYYYPLWKATAKISSRSISLPTSQAADGSLLIAVPAEASEVDVVFFEPPRTAVSVFIAVLGWTFALVLLLSSLLKDNGLRWPPAK